MDRVEFVQLRSAMTVNLPPATAAQTAEAAASLRRRLVSSVMFAQVEVEVTEDPERLLVSMVRFRPGTPERQVASFLEAVWITELRLDGLDVFTTLVEKGHVEFEAATGDQASGYFLSLQLIALEGAAEDFDGTAERQTQPDPEAPRTTKRFWRK